MERLTVDTNLSFCDIARCMGHPGSKGFCPDGSCDQRRCYERLREYERIGTVDQFRDALRRTAEHDKAMEEGRLVVLPCKECFSEAGNNVYLIYCGEVVEVVHCGLSICPVSGNPYIALCAEDKIFPYREGDAEHDTDPTDWCANGCDVAAADFGKTVFLTRQEAEAVLDGGGEDG